MDVQDEINEGLDKLLHEHPEFKKLSMNDPTVYSWIKTAKTFEDRDYIGSVEEVLVGIIVSLGRDKKMLLDQQLDHMKKCTSTTMVVKS